MNLLDMEALLKRDSDGPQVEFTWLRNENKERSHTK